ncbi:hypothetical protein [Cloacibacterium caeni]|uniref:hypothetical protein n=1 Tax=Cloacibacterium caeni TaxID=2004710 RepID=UPI001BD14FE2|nr:hypothetical protein [Cloacibacterium caeni]
MKIKYFEYIAICLSVFLACIFIGNAAREYSIRNGADEFTINLFFWGGIGLGVLIFVFVILFLEPIVNWIVKRFLNNSKSKLVEEQEDDSKNIQIVNSTENFEFNEKHMQSFPNIIEEEPAFEVEKKISETILENEEPIEISDIEKIRIKAKSESEKIVQEKLGFIVQYTKEKFAPYFSDEEINRFSIYLIEFLKDSKIDTITPIRVNTLKTIDLMHFGWNVWHHYRGNNQRKDVAKFLKIVFSESFKEMEESTIEKLLSSRKEEGLIKIEDNLL